MLITHDAFRNIFYNFTDKPGQPSIERKKICISCLRTWGLGISFDLPYCTTLSYKYNSRDFPIPSLILLNFQLVFLIIMLISKAGTLAAEAISTCRQTDTQCALFHQFNTRAD